MWLEEKIGKRINVTRVEQALPHAPQVIATACPYCAVMMYDGVSALGKADEIAVRDIAELVAASMLRAHGTRMQRRRDAGRLIQCVYSNWACDHVRHARPLDVQRDLVGPRPRHGEIVPVGGHSVALDMASSVFSGPAPADVETRACTEASVIRWPLLASNRPTVT